MARTRATTPEKVADDRGDLRRCVGSERFLIKPHDAPLSDFPLQPSAKDGIGRMCKPHWTEYTRGLRNDQLARKGLTPAAKEAIAVEASKGRAKRKAAIPRTGQESPALEEARALIKRIDAMPGPESTVAMATDEAQAALELIAKANGNGRHGGFDAEQAYDQVSDDPEVASGQLDGIAAMTVGEHEDLVAAEDADRREGVA